MRIVKCPECEGIGEYNIEQYWQGKKYLTPVTCPSCNGKGKITWQHFCNRFRKQRNRLT